MPHVSSRKVDEKTLNKIYEMLSSAIISKNVTQKQQRFAFRELFTHTEKIMLGKRLTAIALLSQNLSPYKVGRILKLSPTTTTSLQSKIENGKFTGVVNLCNVLQKGPLQHYIENLLKPMSRYGTSPAKLFKEQ